MGDEPPTLPGERVMLRRVAEADRHVRDELGIDPEIRRMFGGNSTDRRQLSAATLDRWFEDLSSDPFAWVIEHDRRFIGEVRLLDVDLDAGTARVAIGILDPSMLGKGLGREAMWLVMEHAPAIGLGRLSLRVLAYNERAIRMYTALGFEVTEREVGSAIVDGEPHDDLIMQWSALRHT